VRATLGTTDDLNTLSSELFGHERGSFSGAVSKRIGLVEHANGGTLILDELLCLPKHVQNLLLDVTQFGTYRPLGYAGSEPKRVSLRIIGVTNGDLRAAVCAGLFREDLYQRLAHIVIRMPPLRERRGDIDTLARVFLSALAPDWSISAELCTFLRTRVLPWSGNCRQLERLVLRAFERARFAGSERELRVCHVRGSDIDDVSVDEGHAAECSHAKRVMASPVDAWFRIQQMRLALDQEERSILASLVSKNYGAVTQVAKQLGIPRTTLASRLGSLGLAGKAKLEPCMPELRGAPAS
jgi:DNA-binding NtrC family response regulator